MNGDESSDGQGVVPLRTILINFLNLVETYEARRNGGSDSYDSEFQELKQFSETLKCDPDYECKEGEKSVNRKKNRYKDILPFDYTRVILSDYGDVPGSDYINANFIKGASGSSAYIASQGPLPHTVNDFWRMVVECEVQVIVMACNEQESGKHKCENYWVEEDSQEREFGEVTVWLKKCRQVCPDFLVRTMRIRFTNSRGEKEERNVCQFHYSAWPDHGVPTKVRPLLDMVRLIRDRQTSETLPVLVHCSAGCGRTGTICAIDYVWGLLRLGRLTKDFSLFTLVREMRKQRIAMVQTKDQYILVHRAVKELFQEQLKIIDSHPYANVDQDGLPFDLKKELEEPTYEVLDFKKPFVSSGNNSLRSDNEFQDVSGNNNNNNHITVSVSNVNVNSVKSSPPPLPPPSLGPSTTSPPVSSLSSSGETAPSSTPPATVEKSETRTQLVDKSRPSESRSSKKHSTKPSRPSPSPEKTREKKNSSGSSDSEATSKSASNNIRSALLRKPSMSKLKSLFERNPNKEERKPGQLSRAKSDVSTRFYNFTSFGQSRSNNASEAKETAEEGGKGSGSKKTESSSSATSNPKKPPILTKPTIPIKRSKSFKIHQQSDSSSTPIVPITNHVEKSRKKSDNSVSTSSTSSTTQSSSSHTFPSTSTSSPIKVCVKQVEIPKLQAVVSKSIKPEAQIAVTTAQEYDYDIDDRSHLCQKPISQSALQREALQKSSKSNSSLNSPADAVAESSNGIVGQGTKQSSDPQKVAKIPSSSSAFVKPEPPSRTHILKGNRYNNDYANVGFSKGRSRSNSKHKEMEDLLSRSEDRRKFEKLKKCDTVNPRILAASMGLAAPKQERPSLTRSHSHVWQADKTQIPIRIFSDENLHQSLTSTTNFTEKRGLTETNKFPSGGKPADNSEIFIQAIHPEVKSVSSSEYRRNEQEMEISSPSSTTPSAVANSKPIQRRRVPKTNPYANYPACITGSNTNFPYKIPLPTDDTDSYPVNHNDSHHRTGISNIPSLRPSHAGGGNSVGNSSDSSSNTGTPRNSSPGTPTQIVDSVYPKLFRNGRSNPITHESNDSSTPRTNGIINSNGREPKSILKESLASTPSESEEMLDTPRQFPLASSANLPKINTIRIAVGVRERRNSFRQAVWKEAQPASPPDNPIITEQVQQKMPPTSNGTFHQISEHSRIMSSNPFSSGYKTTSEVPKVHRNYEPIWPDPNSSSNVISNGGNNPFYTTSFSSDRTGEMGPSTSNPFTNFSANHLQTNSKLFTDPSTTARPNDPTIFQSKVDEIKVMLAELNSPVTTGDKGFSKEQGESSNSSIPVLKQHRSLRAPSRSHYQQGLSCFAFRKPSSYESIVDQLQHEENPPVKNFNDVTAQAEHSSRTANDYVTLGQCRTVDKVSMTNGFSTGGSSCSPEFAKKFSSQYRHHLQPNESSPSTTPVPPPRTRRNHDNHINVTNSFAIDYSNGNGRSSSWANSNANYSHLPPPDDPATAAASSSVNQNSKYSEPRDDFSNSNTEVNQNEKTLNSTSPKAIIRALGLFQAKAANIRSRLPNWGESKDRSVTKRPLENEASSGPCLDSTKPEENSSVQNRLHEPLCTPLLKPMTSQLTSSGLVQRSKHQYL